MKHVGAVFLAVAVACCSPTTPAPPFVDAGSASSPPSDDVATSCAAACARLATLGCSEGGLTCAATCEHAQRARLTDLRPACLAAARTADEARACGSVACTRKETMP